MSALVFTGPDRRDQRDPRQLGNLLLRALENRRRRITKSESASRAYDALADGNQFVGLVGSYRDER